MALGQMGFWVMGGCVGAEGTWYWVVVRMCWVLVAN